MPHWHENGAAVYGQVLGNCVFVGARSLGDNEETGDDLVHHGLQIITAPAYRTETVSIGAVPVRQLIIENQAEHLSMTLRLVC